MIVTLILYVTGEIARVTKTARPTLHNQINIASIDNEHIYMTYIFAFTKYNQNIYI